MSQIFPERPQKTIDYCKIKSQDLKNNENTEKMYTCIEANKMITETNLVLMNPFTNQQATLQQKHDMLNFREIGMNVFINYVKFSVMDEPSSNPPVRKQNLLTLAPPKKVSKRKLNIKEKELKDVTKYLRRRLDWCRLTGDTFDPDEQYSVYPRALCDSNGIPHSQQISLVIIYDRVGLQIYRHY
jgi:hypothetical protein